MHNLKWNFTKWHCPKCGKQTVIELPGVDEDNAGHQHICYSCKFGFMHDGDYTDLYPNEVDQVVSAAQQVLAQPTRLSGSPADENSGESAGG